MAILKQGKKVVAGTGSGVLAIYSWGYFNDCSDRCVEGEGGGRAVRR